MRIANPLSQQAGKWLVIRRRPESSHKKYAAKQTKNGVDSLAREIFNYLDSSLAGMT